MEKKLSCFIFKVCFVIIFPLQIIAYYYWFSGHSQGYLVFGNPCTIEYSEHYQHIATIYMVTPTYRRIAQMADLTRLAQTLMHVKHLHWILVEEERNHSSLLLDLLNRSGIKYTYLLTNQKKKLPKGYGRGSNGRQFALNWIRKFAELGVLYFGDDDNTYDIRIFEEMRYTNKISMWPVAFASSFGISSPIVNSGKVTDFHDSYASGRKYKVDMAGFAISISFLLQHPNATIPTKAGTIEDGFLRSFEFDLIDIEPKANNCTQVLVWHTRTTAPPNSNIANMKKVKLYNETNLPILYNQMFPNG